MALKWTKTSSPVLVVMKPKPLASLNHLTVPLLRDICESPLFLLFVRAALVEIQKHLHLVQVSDREYATERAGNAFPTEPCAEWTRALVRLTLPTARADVSSRAVLKEAGVRSKVESGPARLSRP